MEETALVFCHKMRIVVRSMPLHHKIPWPWEPWYWQFLSRPFLCVAICFYLSHHVWKLSITCKYFTMTM